MGFCTARKGNRRHKNGIPKKTEEGNMEASIEHKEKNKEIEYPGVESQELGRQEEMVCNIQNFMLP